MILLYPLIVAVASYLAWKTANRGAGSRGWGWFIAWAFDGALFTFSLLTGLSIGLFLLPAAAVAVLWLATSAPYRRELAGFPVGSVLVVAGVFLFV